MNDADSEITLEMPFTVGNWQDSRPITLTLEEGENTQHVLVRHLQETSTKQAVRGS